MTGRGLLLLVKARTAPVTSSEQDDVMSLSSLAPPGGGPDSAVTLS